MGRLMDSDQIGHHSDQTGHHSDVFKKVAGLKSESLPGISESLPVSFRNPCRFASEYASDPASSDRHLQGVHG
jgi:hypothetical protein